MIARRRRHPHSRRMGQVGCPPIARTRLAAIVRHRLVSYQRDQQYYFAISFDELQNDVCSNQLDIALLGDGRYYILI